MPTLQFGTSPSPTADWARDYQRTFSLCEIKCIHLKFMPVSQPAYTRVQGSLTSVGVAQAHPNKSLAVCQLSQRGSSLILFIPSLSAHVPLTSISSTPVRLLSVLLPFAKVSIHICIILRACAIKDSKQKNL